MKRKTLKQQAPLLAGGAFIYKIWKIKKYLQK